MTSTSADSALSFRATLAGILLATLPASAGVIFSESFETPVVSGFSSNTIPSGGKWIGATAGFGATNRGLYNEAVTWPTTPPFATPFGNQAYLLNYTNSGLTTSVGATGQTLTASVSYKVSFNAGIATGTASGSYQVELVAFSAADDNSARANCQGTRTGAVLASASGTVTTNNMSGGGQLTFTPAAGNAHLGKDLGIRLIKGSNSVLYDNIRLVTGHDLNPTPASGVTISGGNISLSWTNMPPTIGADVAVDVWFGTNPSALTKVVTGGLNTAATTVSAPSAATYYWRVDSYPDGNSTSTPVTGDLFTFIVIDTDNDGFPDTYELANTSPSSNTALNPGDDLDTDGLTNLQEYQYATGPNDSDSDNDMLLDGPEITGVAPRPATNPRLADTDADGLSDGAENNTGIWVSISNTGTNPVDADYDNDGLKDGLETKTGTFVSRTTNTGTDPYLADTDSDGAGDWYEVAATYTNPNSAAETSPVPYPLPDPVSTDLGNPTKPVKVYIMSGQSNMVGIGYVSGGNGSLDTITKQENKFPNFVNASNAYTKRNDVIYKGVVTATGQGPLTAGQGADTSRVGVELGFGHVMGWHHDEPVLLLKASEGNRSLGWDFAPPDTTRFDFAGKTYAAYGETPLNWTTGTTPVPINWYAGLQYDMCFKNEADWAPAGVAFGTITNAYDVLKNGILQNLPTADNNLNGRTYEIAGFVWWQGHKDQYDAGHYTRYEQNLARLIPALRTQFNAPNAPFVVATIGFDGGNYALNSPYDYIYKAQKAISDPAKHPTLAGNVKSVDTLGYWRTTGESPGTQGFHYNNNAETYTLVGDALGRAMLDLLDDADPPAPNPPTFATAPTPVNATTVGMVATTATDVSGPVEYYFENITNGNNSGWITSTAWQNTGLTNAVSYDFRYKARDNKGNETGWSAIASAAAGADATAPLPDPMSFTTPPTATGETSITMTATPASDINGVQYEFVCTAGSGPDSGLQNSTTFIATGLSPGTTYSYVVRARDSVGNVTGNSPAASATTTAPDTTAPTPNPMTFAVVPAATGTTSISMTATTASDPSGVEYRFNNTTLATSSPWQDSPIYQQTGLAPSTPYTYTVQARDKSAAQTATAISAPAAATTDTPDTTAPSVSSLNPVNGATSVATNANLTITFSESVKKGAGNIVIKQSSGTVFETIAVSSTTITVTGATVTINPATNLAGLQGYYVEIAGGAVLDVSDNPFAGISGGSTWSFTTATASTSGGIVIPPDKINGTPTYAIVGTMYVLDVPNFSTIPVAGPQGPGWSDSYDVGWRILSGSSLEADHGQSPWEPDGTPVAQARTYRLNSAPGSSYTFNLPDGAVIRGVYATWLSRGTSGAVWSYAEGAATGSNSVGMTAVPSQHLRLKWTDAVSTVRTGDFQRVLSTPITVAGGDGFTLKAVRTGNTHQADAVVLDVTLPGSGAPEIAVEQPAFSNISNGGSKNFDSVTIGLSSSLEFTIRNTGNAALNLSGSPMLDVTGIHAGDFIVSVLPTQPVAAAGTTTFSVEFTPNAVGSRSAILTIANNDSDEAPFIINLTGTGQSSYQEWSANAAFDADSNKDGIDNGMAWLLGAADKDVNALGKLPQASRVGGNLRLAFRCLKSANRGGAQLKVQTSNNLGATDPWSSHEAAVPDTDATVNGVVFDTTDDGDFIYVIADIPTSGAKLFGRLMATE